jgi:hypothetical protein
MLDAVRIHEGGRAGMSTTAHESNRGHKVVWALAAVLWLLPLVAKQFTAEMQWSVGDFVAWAVMLAVAAGIYELGTRLSRNASYRLAMGIAAATGFFVTWVNLAVGIIGDEDNPLNQMYFAVLGVGLLGAVLARFRPLGMWRALLATAFAQFAVALVALALGEMTFVLTMFLVAAWLGSANLFKRAAEEQAAVDSTG